MKRETLTDVLNRVEALIRSGASSFKELSKEFNRPESRFSEWITMRRPTPSGEIAIELRSWAEAKSAALRGKSFRQFTYALRDVRRERKTK